MRICLFADGESIHTQRWCQHFFDRGHDVHLITFKNVEISNIKVHYISGIDINVSGGNWKVILKTQQVKKIIKKIQPQVLHSLYATSYGFVGALSGFHPYIVTPLGTDILISPNQSVFYRTILRYVFKKADLITSMAPHLKEAILKFGAKKEKIRDILFGINTSIFNKEKRAVSEKEFVICSTRNFEPVYNIPHFLKAIALLKDQIPNLKVKIIGYGTLKDDLIKLAKDLQIDNIVSFYGKVPQSKVVEVLNQSHVFVTVSLSDGNSMSLIEAMACGAYPVATDILANKQWITEGINGSFVKVNDVEGLAKCLVNIYKNYDSIINRAQMESDKIIAEKGTWNANMSKMEEIYLSI
jgi:glycosyltransferase involved in cell wall biosynthesis